jgi:hypothetical protein
MTGRLSRKNRLDKSRPYAVNLKMSLAHAKDKRQIDKLKAKLKSAKYYREQLNEDISFLLNLKMIPSHLDPAQMKKLKSIYRRNLLQGLRPGGIDESHNQKETNQLK